VIELAAGPATATVDPAHGARLASLTVDGLELLVTAATDPLEWGLYPMAPFAGRLRHGRFTFAGQQWELPCNLPPHAIHGTVFDARWDDEGAGVLSTPLVEPWPFPGRVVQRFVLAPDSLTLILEVHATDGPMPASCGWHPWWRRRLDQGAAVEIDFDAATMYVRDGDGIPTGELVTPPRGPYDDCFTGLRRPPQLRWPGALALTVESTCDHVVVFDERPDAVCVEPQTGPPDALNLGPAVVHPGRPLVATMVLRWATA
jgi:aldose 1-epimerase